jgi:hypothetical protein
LALLGDLTGVVDVHLVCKLQADKEAAGEAAAGGRRRDIRECVASCVAQAGAL